MLYVVGEPEVALNASGVVCAPELKQTVVAVASVVMVGTSLTVTVNVVPVLTHPFAFLTVIVPV